MLIAETYSRSKSADGTQTPEGMILRFQLHIAALYQVFASGETGAKGVLKKYLKPIDYHFCITKRTISVFPSFLHLPITCISVDNI